MDQNEIRTVVNSAVLDWLQSPHIIEVLTSRDADFDGDHIVCITIIVNAPPAAFDRERLAGLVTRLREALAEINEEDFPMVSFKNQTQFEVAAA